MKPSKTNTDEKVVIRVLSARSHSFDIYSRRQAKDLLDVVIPKKMNFHSGFKSLVHALVAGRLNLDVVLLRRAGATDSEQYLDLVLLGHSNKDIKAITAHYKAVTKPKGKPKGKPKSLLRALEGDLSGDTKTLYRGLLRAERRWEDPNVPITQAELEANIRELYQMTPEKVLEFLMTASMHRLASISNSWKKIKRRIYRTNRRCIREGFTYQGNITGRE